jgi:hypothetical protein
MCVEDIDVLLLQCDFLGKEEILHEVVAMLDEMEVLMERFHKSRVEEFGKKSD